MKMFARALPLIGLLLTSCSQIRQVDFVWFNLSGREIRVTGISGLPGDVIPGVLIAVSDDTNRLNEASLTFFESIRAAETIKIVWDEGGATHSFEAKRVDLSVPVRLDGGQLRFSYLGADKWRIRFVGRNK
jgi:hypothetical protein